MGLLLERRMGFTEKERLGGGKGKHQKLRKGKVARLSGKDR
jgi:hypothetical protein